MTVVGLAVSGLAALLLTYLVWLSESRGARAKAWQRQAERCRDDYEELAFRTSAVFREHARDGSNPRGPWCGTCLTAWPCRTVELLTTKEARHG